MASFGALVHWTVGIAFAMSLSIAVELWLLVTQYKLPNSHCYMYIASLLFEYYYFYTDYLLLAS